VDNVTNTSPFASHWAAEPKDGPNPLYHNGVKVGTYESGVGSPIGILSGLDGKSYKSWKEVIDANSTFFAPSGVVEGYDLDTSFNPEDFNDLPRDTPMCNGDCPECREEAADDAVFVSVNSDGRIFVQIDDDMSIVLTADEAASLIAKLEWAVEGVSALEVI